MHKYRVSYASGGDVFVCRLNFKQEVDKDFDETDWLTLAMGDEPSESDRLIFVRKDD